MTNKNKTKAAGSHIAGHIDYVGDGYVGGWAKLSSPAANPPIIEILNSGEVVARGLANEYRADLKAAGIGEGNHGFTLRLSTEMFDGKPRTLIGREAATGQFFTKEIFKFEAQIEKRNAHTISRARGLDALRAIVADSTNGEISPDAATRLESAYRVGALAQETGRHTDALAIWNAIEKALGAQALSACKMAEAYAEQNQADIALTYYRKAIGLDVSCFDAHFGMTGVLLESGRYLEAEPTAKATLSLAPKTRSLQRAIVDCITPHLSRWIPRLIEAGNLDLALRLASLVVLQQPDNTEASALLSDLTLPATVELSNLTDAQTASIRRLYSAIHILAREERGTSKAILAR